MFRSRALVLLSVAAFAAITVACQHTAQSSGDAAAPDGPSATATPTITPPPAASATATPAVDVTPTTPPPTPIPGTPVPLPDGGWLNAGDIARGGFRYRIGTWTVEIPAGVDLEFAVVASDPGGFSVVLFDPKSGSSIHFSRGGKEKSRYVTDPGLRSVFDSMSNSVASD